MSKKRMHHVFFVFNSTLESSMRILLYLTIFLYFMISFKMEVLQRYWILLIPLLLLALRLSDIVIINKQRISCYRLFRKRLILNWNEVTHYGTFKADFCKNTSWYVYFSKRVISLSPYDGIPTMNSDFIYVSHQDGLKEMLLLYNKKKLAETLFGKVNTKNTQKFLKNRRVLFSSTYGIVFTLLQLYSLRTGQQIWRYISVIPAVLIIIGYFKFMKDR